MIEGVSSQPIDLPEPEGLEPEAATAAPETQAPIQRGAAAGAREAVLSALASEGSLEGAEPGPDPALELGDDGEYVHVDGPAFRGGPQYTDVDQGGLADCWLMGGLAALAHTDPEYLTRAVETNRDGTFTIHFWERYQGSDGRFRFRRHDEVVRPTFPHKADGKPVYADPTPNNEAELWVALIEKGFAQWKGGSYDAIASGQARNLMMAITGKTATRTSITETYDEDLLWEKLNQADCNDHPVALGTRDSGLSEGDLVAWHTYAVLDVYEKDGERMVKLYNPYGANDQGIDRHLEFPLRTIRDNFKSLYIGTS